MEEFDLDDFDFGTPKQIRNGLRHYQLAAIKAIDEGWGQYNSQLVEIATGCGKTVIFCSISEEWTEREKKVLILAHTDELIEQAIDKMERFTGIAAGKEKASDMASVLDSVVCGSVQTLCRDKRLFTWDKNHFDLIIVDEAHRSLANSYIKILEYFKEGGAKVLGVTATADRGDKRGLVEVFEHCAYEYNLLNAVKDGYLVRPIVKQIPIKLDMRGAKVKQGDLDATEVSKKISPFLEQIAKSIIQESKERKTIIFMPSIETAREIANYLRSFGASADYVSGQCKDRKQKIDAYKDGKIQYMANAMLLTEGYDDDSISCVVMLRPTKIRALYAQCVGRGTRTLTGLIDNINSKDERLRLIANSAKPNLLILDFLWISERLKLINPIDLIADGNKKLKDKMEELKDEQMDLIEIEETAERDLLESLEKEASKHKSKKSRLFDPLNFVDLTDELKNDKEIMTERQKEILLKNGIRVDSIISRKHAAIVLDRVFSRHRHNLSTPKQMNLLGNFGIKYAEKLTRDQAQKMISDILASKRK